MSIARAAEKFTTAQSGLTHRTLADSCFCLDRAQPCRVADLNQMYRMVLGCNSDNGGGRELLKALRRGPTHHCIQRVCTPYLGLRVLQRGHEHQCHAAGRRPDQPIRADLPQRGRTALLPAKRPQPI